MSRRLVVLLGGTFDPVHLGHLNAAHAARRALGVEAATLVLSARPPHRTAVASAAHRFAMLRLATADEPGLVASGTELRRPGPSYSIDTLRAFAGPGRSVVWLLGSDSLSAFREWRDVEAFPRCGHVAVLARPGAPPSTLPGFKPARRPECLRESAAGRLLVLEAAMLNVAATDIRARVQRGEDATHLLKPAVKHYICRHGLYRD